MGRVKDFQYFLYNPASGLSNKDAVRESARETAFGRVIAQRRRAFAARMNARQESRAITMGILIS